jgi:hypothetical protein
LPPLSAFFVFSIQVAEKRLVSVRGEKGMKTSLVFKGFSFWLTPAAPSNVQKRVPREFKQLLPARIGDTLMHRLRSPWLCPSSWGKENERSSLLRWLQPLKQPLEWRGACYRPEPSELVAAISLATIASEQGLPFNVTGMAGLQQTSISRIRRRCDRLDSFAYAYRCCIRGHQPKGNCLCGDHATYAGVGVGMGSHKRAPKMPRREKGSG